MTGDLFRRLTAAAGQDWPAYTRHEFVLRLARGQPVLPRRGDRDDVAALGEPGRERVHGAVGAADHRRVGVAPVGPVSRRNAVLPAVTGLAVAGRPVALLAVALLTVAGRPVALLTVLPLTVGLP